MFESSHTAQSLKREAALPDRPLLDFVDYIHAVCGLDHSVFEDATRDDAFVASVASYVSTGMICLGYAAHCFFERRRTNSPISTKMQAVDYVRLASYRQDLPEIDPRSLSISADRLKANFPDLFPETRIGDPRNLELRERMLATMAPFATEHPLCLTSFVFARTADQAAYVDYWLARSEAQISEYLKDARFLAGLHAMSEGLLSFHGLLENVCGKDYEHVWKPKQYALFRDLDPLLTRPAVFRLANQIADGRRTVPPDLPSRFPHFYKYYDPEAFGRRD
ncbi:MAG: hypothetical protein FD144_3873 [Rhodospirillaceae bacterium]|nr:MAG: hypothetical protein FD144_3873 [Rhodospirillaceae bacterium]